MLNMFNAPTSGQVYTRSKRLFCRFFRAKLQFSFRGILVRLLFFSFGLNLLLFVLQGRYLELQIDHACTLEGKTMCTNQGCLDKIAVVNANNKTADNAKDRIIFSVKDGDAVTRADAVLAGKYLGKKVFLTIGIPTVKRKGRNYLTTTLDSLLYNVSKAKDFSAKVVVLLADIEKSVREERLHELSSRYTKYLANGDIHVITVPKKVYPPLRGLSKTLDDTELRMFWRSKQAIDFAFLMQYSKSFSPYYLQLEDDVIATRDYDVYMRRYMKEKEGKFWFNLDFSNLGFIGKLYRSETLENQARFFRLFYDEMPVDLLMSAYRTILGNEVSDITYFRNLFVHIGYESSALTR